MRLLLLATLPCILAIPLLTTPIPAVSEPVLTTATTHLSCNQDKVKELYKKLLKLRKEVSILEAKMKQEQAKGYGPKNRMNSRRLAHLKKAITVLETRIKTLKTRQPAKVRAKAFSKGKSPCKCSKCKEKARAKTPSRRSGVRPGPKKSHRYHTDTLEKIKENLKRLIKEKASLELKLKKTNAEIHKARRALAGLMREQAQRVRKSRMEARKRAGTRYRKAPRRLTGGITRLRAAHKQAEEARRTAARKRIEAMKKAAALRKRTAQRAHRHPVPTPRLRRKPAAAPRTEMQGGAVLKELRLLRHEVARIRVLLESALRAHKKAAPAKPKKRKAMRKDYRTL